MRFLIAGAGAIGAYIGARMAQAGFDVTLFARGPHLHAMQERGVQVKSSEGDFVARPAVAGSLEEVGPVDVVFLGVKAHGLPQLAPSLKPALGPDTTVVSTQNGIPWWYFQGFGGEWEGLRLERIDPAGVISSAIEARRVIGSIIYFATEISEPGVVQHTEGNRITLGEPDGTRSERIRAVAEALIASGFRCPVTTRIRHEIWVKVLGNASFNPVSALTRATLAQIARDPGTAFVIRSIMQEVEQVSTRLGMELPISIDQRIAGAEKVGEHKTSMLQDLEAGRPMELEALVGSVVELGERVGLPMTCTRTVYNCTKLLAQGAATYDRRESEETQALSLKLEQQARVFDTTLSSITDFAYIFDRDGRFAYANQALLNLWGLRLEDAIGKNFFDLKYPDDLAAKLQSQIQQVIDTRLGLKDETPYTSPTGAGGYYEYIFSPVLDKNGEVEVVAGSTRDITERKRVEQLLRESEEKYRSLADALESQVRSRTQELELRNAEVLNQTEQVRDLARRLLKAQDDERRHIARELHDTAGQTLVVLCMNMATLIKEANEVDPDLAKKLAETEQLVQGLSKEIRTASYLLHPPLLDEGGLPAALRWYVSGLAERSHLDIRLSISEDFERLPDDLALVVFRLVQECMTNIHRHSESKSAAVRIQQNRGTVIIEVEDRGHGMTPERLAQIQLQGSGVGIQGMRERIRQLHGDLSIDSSSAGTKITAVLPVSKP